MSPLSNNLLHRLHVDCTNYIKGNENFIKDTFSSLPKDERSLNNLLQALTAGTFHYMGALTPGTVRNLESQEQIISNAINKPYKLCTEIMFGKKFEELKSAAVSAPATFPYSEDANMDFTKDLSFGRETSSAINSYGIVILPPTQSGSESCEIFSSYFWKNPFPCLSKYFWGERSLQVQLPSLDLASSDIPSTDTHLVTASTKSISESYGIFSSHFLNNPLTFLNKYNPFPCLSKYFWGERSLQVQLPSPDLVSSDIPSTDTHLVTASTKSISDQEEVWLSWQGWKDYFAKQISAWIKTLVQSDKMKETKYLLGKVVESSNQEASKYHALSAGNKTISQGDATTFASLPTESVSQGPKAYDSSNNASIHSEAEGPFNSDFFVGAAVIVLVAVVAYKIFSAYSQPQQADMQEDKPIDEVEEIETSEVSDDESEPTVEPSKVEVDSTRSSPAQGRVSSWLTKILSWVK